MISVTFVCGHTGSVSETAQAAPTCGCGEQQVRRVAARAPRFIGACSGPYCETRMLEPAVVNVAPAGPLTLKTPKD